MNDTTLKPAIAVRREIPHTVSPGLWTLAWRRLRNDGVAMVSLAIVAAFVLLMVLSGAGLVAKDWAKEIGVNYAPPTFLGPEAAPALPEPAAKSESPAVPSGATPGSTFESTVVDPLADPNSTMTARVAALANSVNAMPL